MIIFDFDGVLVDSLAQHLGAYQQVFRRYQREFHLNTANEWREKYRSDWEHNFYQGGFSHEEMREAMRSYFHYIDYAQVSLYPGIKELIPELSQLRPLAICSSTDSSIIRDRLALEGLDGYFQLILGSSETSSKLGKLEEIFSSIAADKQHSVYVGDTSADVRAGKEFGVNTIGVSYGWYAADRIQSENPSAVAKDVAELKSHILRMIAS